MTAGDASAQPEETGVSDLQAGSKHYRAFIGPPGTYDVTSPVQFGLLTALGLREHHTLLDIGCGSLRGGRLFIPYLLPEHYFGIEPEEWLLDEGLRQEVGKEQQAAKRPAFSNDGNFTLTTFGRSFDFLLAQSIFSHAYEAQISRCLEEARKVMEQTSIFVATFVLGEEDHKGNEWVYPGCSRYTLEKMQSLARDHGLSCRTIDWPHPTQQTWILITDPANETIAPDTGDAGRTLLLEQELRLYQERLARMEGHPYVRFGLAANQFLQSMKQKAESMFSKRRSGS